MRWIDHDQVELLRVLPPMLGHQEAAFTEFFSTYNGCRLTRQQLKAVADPLPPDVKAEESFSWERPRMSQLTQYRPEKRQERDEFLDDVYQRGLGRSRDEVEYWFNQFCNAMFDWLINREKPVDLYFARIHPMPFRTNWKIKARQWIKKYGMTGLVDDGKLFALDGDVCLRYLEIELLKPWRRSTLKVEQQRLKVLGRLGYAKAILESGRRQADAATRILRDWKADAKTQSVVFFEGGGAGSNGVVKIRWRRKMGRQVIEIRRLARRTVFGARPRPKKPVRPKKSKLSKLRVVQPAPPDVWDGRDYLPPSDYRKDRLKGVLVLLAAQKRDVDELLAVRSNPGPNGVAEGVEQLAG